MRFGRLMCVATLVPLLALIPLSTLISPGQFEVRFPSSGVSFDLDLTVTLTDRTGLARGIAVAQPLRGIGPEVSNYGADGRMLIVELDGSSCDLLTALTLEPSGAAGMVLQARTHKGGCAIGTAKTRAVAISLWAPIDAANVRFESTD